MQTFTAWQYLLIDAANQFGLDKQMFEERIHWTLINLNQLEKIAEDRGWWKERPLYVKATQAIRKAQKGIPTGHLVGFDAVCSGVQIMSALTGCHAGGSSTGLVDTGSRPDAYTSVTYAMNEILEEQGLSVHISRDEAKRATMTSYYGSKKTPKNIFGEGTPQLDAFYKASSTVAPGAWSLLGDLLGSWNAGALYHAWKLPDGYDARVKVMEKIENTPQNRVEVDELDHMTFTYVWYENRGTKQGLSNIANVVHSIDAYILRCVHRRCNYDEEMIDELSLLIEEALLSKIIGNDDEGLDIDGQVSYYVEQYKRSGMADVVVLPFLDSLSVYCLTKEHLQKLSAIITGMKQYKPFHVVTVHDEFKCLAGNMNWLRWQYKEILAEISESKLLDDILSQLYHMPVKFQKMGTDIGIEIRNSNYALC